MLIPDNEDTRVVYERYPLNSASPSLRYRHGRTRFPISQTSLGRANKRPEVLFWDEDSGEIRLHRFLDAEAAEGGRFVEAVQGFLNELSLFRRRASRESRSVSPFSFLR